MTGAETPIFLVGFMGSGKSTVGRRLAATLGLRFTDLDERVEAREGRSIETIFRDSGEATFRRAEWEALRSLEPLAGRCVAAGGGAFLRFEIRRWMQRHGRVLWLDVPLETARERVGDGAGRPLWSREDGLALRSLYERRRAIYALAELRVDDAGDPVETIVDRVRRRLGAISR